MDDDEFDRRLNAIEKLCRGMNEDQLQTVIESACDWPVEHDDDEA